MALREAYESYLENIRREALPGNPLEMVTLEQLPKLALGQRRSRAELEEEIKVKTTTLLELDEAIEGQSRQARKYTTLVAELQKKNEDTRRKVEALAK